MILFRPAPHQNYINSLKLEMVEIDRYVSITLTDNTSGTFSTYLFPFVFGKQKLFSQLYDIMPSCRCCYIACIVFINAACLERLNFWIVNGHLIIAHKRNVKKNQDETFFLLFKFILCTILGERNQFDFYTFCILCSNAVLYSYHDTRFRILSKTCEHIFMLIALYTLYFVVKLLEQKCLTS